jgi:hypothetical protein
VRDIQESLNTQKAQIVESPTSEPEEAQAEEAHNDHQSQAQEVYRSVTRLSRSHYHKSAFHVIWEKRDKNSQTWRRIGFELFIGGFKVIEIETALHTSEFSCSWISSNIRMRNVIPASSEIVRACKEGNLVTVRDLFKRGKARPNDMTDEQHPILFVRAIPENFRRCGQANKDSVVCYSERLGRSCQMSATRI